MATNGVFDYNKVYSLAHQLLEAIGENPDRDGLKDTPKRYADWWQEFIDYKPGKIETAFESHTIDQMIVVTGMRVWSICEHHLLPFWCDVTIGYIPNKKILGLSKFARIAHQFAHKLQVQENLTANIADQISTVTQSGNVAVVIEGQHLCMVMRGIKSASNMHTSVMKGAFRIDSATRSEFFSIIDRSSR